MGTPQNLTELRIFVAMVNYMGQFISELSSVISPMADVLNSGSVWLWDQTQVFSHVKQLITRASILAL